MSENQDIFYNEVRRLTTRCISCWERFRTNLTRKDMLISKDFAFMWLCEDCMRKREELYSDE